MFLNNEAQQTLLNKSIKIKSSIISHCPEKFEQIMKCDGICKQTIKDSLDINQNIDRIFSAGEGAG